MSPPITRRTRVGTVALARRAPRASTVAARTSPVAWGGLRELRRRFSGALGVLAATAAGAAAGFIVVLCAAGLPGVPSLVVGLGMGAVVGVGSTLVFVSRFPLLRRTGAVALLLAPVFFVISPFLLLMGAGRVLRGKGTRRRRAP